MLQHFGSLRLLAQGTLPQHEVLSGVRLERTWSTAYARLVGKYLRHGGGQTPVRCSDLIKARFIHPSYQHLTWITPFEASYTGFSTGYKQ